MNRNIITLITLSVSISGCGSTAATTGAGLVVAPQVDRGLNAAMGGNPAYTISTEDAISRAQSSKFAKDRCHAYNLLAWYDLGFFAINGQNKGRDHCEKWCMYEHGVEADCITDNRYKPGEVVNYDHMHNNGEWVK